MSQCLRNQIVVGVCVLRAETVLQAKLFLKGVVEPQSGRGAAEEVVVLREDAPYLARVGRLPAIVLRNPKRLQRNSLRVEHPEDIVIGSDE